MPGAVVNAGLADRVLALDAVVPEIVRLANPPFGVTARQKELDA